MIRTLVAGAIAGAAGELVLNVVSYGDMFVRARPASEMPARVVRRMTDIVGVELSRPGERADKAATRREAGGALMGYLVAVVVAMAYAAVRRLGMRVPWPLAGLAIGGGAMALSDSVATAVGAADPTTWDTASWLLDIGPHAAYGVTAAATLEFIDPA